MRINRLISEGKDANRSGFSGRSGSKRNEYMNYEGDFFRIKDRTSLGVKIS